MSTKEEKKTAADAAFKRKLPRNQKQRRQTIEGNLAPAKKWCSLFVNAFKNRDLEGISQEQVSDVQAWKIRGEELRKKFIRDHTTLLLMLSPEDTAMRSKAMAMFMKYPRKWIKDTMTKHGISLNSEGSDDEDDKVDEETKLKKKMERAARVELRKKLPNAHFGISEYTPSYHAAGIFPFAVRSKKDKQEIVVLMLAEQRSRDKPLVLNFPGGKQDFKLDLGDPVSTALREFKEETAHIFDYDSDNLEHRMRSESNTLGLTRCLLQQGSYFILFGQVPYLPEVNAKFAENKEKFKFDDSATVRLLWVPLQDLIQARRKLTVEVEPGNKESRQEYSIHTLVEQLLALEKVSERVQKLSELCSGGQLSALDDSATENTNSSKKKRKRSETEDKDEFPRRSFGDNEDDFGDTTMRLINFNHVDWEGLISKSIHDLAKEADSGSVSKKQVRKAVVTQLCGELRPRLDAICDAKLETLGAFDVYNGFVFRSKSKNKRRKLN